MRVFYKKRFEKNFKKLPPKLKEQFYEQLEVFIKDKFHKSLNNHAVDRVFPGCRSINVTGDFRAIYSEKGELIIFVTIGTHSELYK